MTLPWHLPQTLGGPGECWDDNHFRINAAGALLPQPWMQWRQVAAVSVPTRSGSYGVTMGSGSDVDVVGTLESLFGSLLGTLLSVFGPLGTLFSQAFPQASSITSAGNKNDLLHDIQTSYTNDSPIDQWVYGKVTQGGQRVTLQARSRGGLYLSSGYAEGDDAGDLMESSMCGVGADIGRGGSLSLGTTFCVAEQRANSGTIPLAPERAQWHRLSPGSTLTARAQLRFISEFWENTTIDGGDSGTESSYETGGLRLDLFAVPAID